MKKEFYIQKGVIRDDDSNFKKPLRILEYDSTFPFKPQGSTPYSSVKELRKLDQVWKEYYVEDPKSAEKICHPNFIISVADFTLTPHSRDFNQVSYKLLKHTILGELSNDICGLHLISSINHSIKNYNQIKTEDRNGVWVADISYYSEKRKTMYFKKKTSMFPKNWTPSIFMFEIHYAYMNKKQCEEKGYIYHSRTLCGVPVDFVFREGQLKSVYPIYQDQ